MSSQPKVINFAEAYAEHLQGFASADCPDLEILINNEILKVHKIILACANEVFKENLKSQMVDSQQNRMEITDCDPAAFKTFLVYLYTGDVRPEDVSVGLLVIAEKYLDVSLKEICLRELPNNITMDNLVETAQIATQNNYVELIAACKKFFIENGSSLIGTPQLEAIVENETFLTGIFDEYHEESVTVDKKYNELLTRSKKHKFVLGGVNALIVFCYVCKNAKENCSCYRKRNIFKQSVHPLRFFAEGVEWRMELAMDAERMIGVQLKAVDKNVQADVRLTVFSNNRQSPNIRIEKKNKPFGVQFFKVLPRDRLARNNGDYVRRNIYLTVELTINVLNSVSGARR